MTDSGDRPDAEQREPGWKWPEEWSIEMRQWATELYRCRYPRAGPRITLIGKLVEAALRGLPLEARTGCPCTWVEPCSSACSCASSVMSGGCTRCCGYGSDEQRLAAATDIATRLDGPPLEAPGEPPLLIDVPDALVETIEDELAEFGHHVSGDCAQYVAYAAWLLMRASALPLVHLDLDAEAYRAFAEDRGTDQPQRVHPEEKK